VGGKRFRVFSHANRATSRTQEDKLKRLPTRGLRPEEDRDGRTAVVGKAKERRVKCTVKKWKLNPRLQELDPRAGNQGNSDLSAFLEQTKKPGK